MAVSLAMLLQSQIDPQLDAPALIAQLRSDWPDLDPDLLRPTPREELQADGNGDSQVLSIDYDGYLIALMPIPAPIGDDIAALCAHSRLWPNATPAPEGYAAHTIVTVMHFGGEDADAPGAIAQAALLSRVLASAIALSDSIQAVYFGSANHVVLPALFRELARDILPEPMPLAWVAINVGQRPDGVMTGHTRGMDMLGLMDIEIPSTGESAEDVFGRLTGICHYLIENGLVIGDGDTLGSSDEERIKVVYGPSALGDDRQVMSLQHEAIEPEPPAAKSWWKKLLH